MRQYDITERVLGTQEALLTRTAGTRVFGSSAAVSKVQTEAYAALLPAMKPDRHADFERIPRSGGRKLNDPQAAFTFHLLKVCT
jgi:hypothetical protein